MDKREAIINAAKKRFNHYGIAKTTMQEIANDADLAVGTLYLYFKNKDALVVACANDFGKEHLKVIDEILNSNLKPDEKLKKYILSRFKSSEETRETPHAIEIVRALLKVYPERLDEESSWMYQTICKILEEGVTNKIFKIENIPEDTEVFLYSIAIFFPLAFYEMKKWPTQESLIKSLDWFINKWKM